MDGKPEDWHVDWCRNLFDRLAQGGVWGIPRSGLIFEKRGHDLVLTSQMPHIKEMPITPEQLAEQQESEYENVKRHFGLAGITVYKVYSV